MNSITKLERILSLARTGLNYPCENPYHIDIFKSIVRDLLAIGSRCHFDYGNLSDLFTETGLITPKTGSVVGIINEACSLLVLKRKTGAWCLPCGYAEIGESPEEAARREVLEETGISLDALTFIGISDTKDDPKIPFMWEAVFLSQVSLNTIKLSQEHTDFKWIQSTESVIWHSTHQFHAHRVFSYIKEFRVE